MIEKLKAGDSREMFVRLNNVNQGRTQGGTVYSVLNLIDKDNIQFSAVMYETKGELLRYVHENTLIRAQVTAKANGQKVGYIVKSVRQTEDAVYPCKYPKEILDSKTANKTLSITAELFEASINNPVSDPKKVQKPYYIYSEPFSRFVVTIMNKENNGNYNSLSANIPVNDIAAIFEDARATRMLDTFFSTGMMQKIMLMLSGITNMVKGTQKALQVMFTFMKRGSVPGSAGVQGSNKNAAAVQAKKEELKAKASSVTMTMGAYKGKTPFGFIGEKLGDPAEMKKQADQLRGQPDFLRKNLDKYPANQKQIDAIEAALAYYDAGYFNDADGSAVEETPSGFILEIPLLKAEPKPNRFKRDDKTGLCPVYELSIKYLVGYRSPIQFTLITYDAPVDTKQTGAINVQQSQAQNKKTAQFNLRWVEFANFMRRTEAHMRRFEMLCAKKQFAEAEKASRENREAAKREKELQQAAGQDQSQPQQQAPENNAPYAGSYSQDAGC